jgi:hypothetical protein
MVTLGLWRNRRSIVESNIVWTPFSAISEDHLGVGQMMEAMVDSAEADRERSPMVARDQAAEKGAFRSTGAIRRF